MDFHALSIKQIIPETAESVTIELDVPAHLAPLFEYKPGQYITLKHEKDGRELRRSYSMSSSPLENRLAITVKKVAGGRVSTHLCEQAKVGDTLHVAAPDGRFTMALHPEKRRTYYFFAAGSGITPLMSLSKAILESEPMSAVFLLYGNRNEESIIFRAGLDQLSERYAGQFHVEHILSRPKKESGGGGLFGLFKKSMSNWQGKTGRIDAATVKVFLDENMPHGPESDCEYFACGPGDMPDTVKISLQSRGIPDKQIHLEHFANADHAPGENIAADASGGARLIFHLKGHRHETTIPPGASILDVLVKEKFDPPYSCTAGACSTCMAKVISGKVAMDVCYALDDDEVKAGYCLTCQSKPETGVVEISYDM